MKIKSWGTNIMIGVLCFSLVVGIVLMIGEMRSFEEKYYRTEDPFLYAIQAKDYARLIEASHHNRAMKNGKSEKFVEYHGVADYFEAASYYHAYVENGQRQKAERMKKRMEEAVAKMGRYQYLKDEIHEILGMEIPE